MRFKTRHPEGDAYDGVVVHIAHAFVALREEVDFEFDGIIILPKSAVRGVRNSTAENCANEILRQNGALQRLKIPSWLAGCATIPDVLGSLMKRSIWPAIEMLFADGDTALYLGPVESASEEGFKTWCYDSEGVWENGYSFRWNEIFRIEFDSRYCNHFNRYMQAKKRPEKAAYS